MRILPSLLFFVIMSTCIISCNKEETLINDIKFELKTELWPNEGGSIIPSSGKYSANIIKSIYARPKPGWVFDRWEGAVSGNDNPTQIAFFADHAIRAVFVKDTFKIRTMAGGKGKGTDLNQLYYPTGIALDPTGDLLVSDMYNHRIQKWMPGATVGITVAGGNGFGMGDDQLDEPGKIEIDAQGSIFIADTRNQRIQKWEFGALKGETVAGGKGMGEGLNQFNKPFGIALDKEGYIYVSEIGNNRVTKWAPGDDEGIIVAGGNGEGNAPNQLALPLGLTVDNEGNVYVADTYNHRIQLWRPGAVKGETLFSLSNTENESGLTYFSGVTYVEKENYLLITDYQQKRIIRFNLENNTHETVVGNTNDINQADLLAQPYQITLDILGDIIIADAKNNRIQKWKPETKN